MDGDNVMDEIEKMLKNLTGSKATVMVRFSQNSTYTDKLTSIYRQGWIKGTGTQGRDVVPPKSLQKFAGKDHCRDKDQWVDRNPPHGPPEGEFGIVFVSVENVEQDKVDHAIAKLNGTAYVSCEPPFTPIPY